MDLAKEVTCRQSYAGTRRAWGAGQGYGRQREPRHHVVAVDYGAKRNILRMLAEHGCRVTVVPATASAEDILRHRPDGVFLSNGPGDPAATGDYAVPVLRELIACGKPIFGICLGHQLLALALGGQTAKMGIGHRGANHPVKDLATGKVEITSQNHGFVRRPREPAGRGRGRPIVSLFDGINEGLRIKGKPVFSVQYHPEAAPARRTATTCSQRFVDADGGEAKMPEMRACLNAPTSTRILIIGAGPIVIGQACEFDYSGAQAVQGAEGRGLPVVLVNSNPATIMTDPDLADATYIEPITPEMVEQIIATERPDALLPTMGGQTALNTAMALARSGVLERYGVELIGAQRSGDRQGRGPPAVPRGDGPDRPRLARRAGWCARSTRRSRRSTTIGLPAIIRPSFTLAGTGGGIAYNREEFEEIVARRAARLADARGADRGIGARLEGIRDGGRARPRRQLHHRLLDREHRPDGRPHRRFGLPSPRR